MHGIENCRINVVSRTAATGHSKSKRSKTCGCGLAAPHFAENTWQLISADVSHDVLLDEYIKAAGITSDRKAPLFRSALGKTGRLSDRPMLRGDVWRMVRRRTADAGIETAIGCHTFRATGITDYLTNGGRIEVAQRMAGHSNAKTTGLYDRRNDDISVGEVERIGI